MHSDSVRLSAVAFLAGAVSFGALAQNGGNPTPQQVLAGWGGSDPWLDLNDDGTVDAADYAIAVSLQSGSSAPVTPSLSAGAGFTAATAQPPSQGLSSQPGYNAKAMARWNFVPHQTFDSEFGIGVVAFHAYGIDRVEFSLNGGPWTAVTEPTMNPMSNTVEYWVKVDPEQLATGEQEVRAIAYPQVGIPRVLGGALNGTGMGKGEYSMYFVANAAATLPSVQRFVSPTGSDTSGNGTRGNPFRTIMKAVHSINQAGGGKADGGVVNLLAGDHNLGSYSYGFLSTTDKRWLTVRPAPGVASAAAPIVSASPSGLNLSLVRFSGVTFKPTPSSNTHEIIVSSWGARRLWLDGCKLKGISRTNASWWTSGWQQMWFTDCQLTDCANGLWGELVRGMQIDTIGSDAFSGAMLCVNSSVRKVDPSGTTFHPDIYQLYAPNGAVSENCIVYGARLIEPSNTQGLFAGHSIPIKDVAFVDVSVDSRVTGVPWYQMAFQFGGPTTHMLVQDCNIMGPAEWRVDMAFTASDIVIRNTDWSYGGPAPSPINGVVVVPD